MDKWIISCSEGDKVGERRQSNYVRRDDVVGGIVSLYKNKVGMIYFCFSSCS